MIIFAFDSFKGLPRMTVTKHDGITAIKCTAEGNRYPPKISWQIDDGPEISGKLEVNCSCDN